jgi:hypothetical protein
MTIMTQALTIKVYFISIQTFALLWALFGDSRASPNVILAHLMSVPTFFLIFYFQLYAFSSKLKMNRKSLFDKYVQVNPLNPKIRWAVGLSSLFSNSAYESLKGDFSIQRKLVRDCFIYFVAAFVLFLPITILAFSIH